MKIKVSEINATLLKLAARKLAGFFFIILHVA